MRIKFFLTSFAICVFLLKSGFCQSQLFVSLKGNDLNAGTKEKPFRSISKAQYVARKVKGSITVYIREGIYFLKEPIVFVPKDSRENHQKIIFTAFNKEKVILSGGTQLLLKWKDYKENIKQANVMGDLIFDQLFVNGQSQHMARYPNYNSTARVFGGTSKDAISFDRIKTWGNPEGGYVHALHPSEWGSYHFLIRRKNEKGEIIMERKLEDTSIMATNFTANLHKEFLFTENIFEELDTVNEWFYNKNLKVLYYYPQLKVNLSRATIVTPQLESLIKFKGTQQHPINNISIDGITLTQTLRTFMKTNERLSRGDWSIYRGGAVFMEGTENCNIKNCIFTELGGNAVFVSNFNRNNEISGCLFKNIGASAVCYCGDRNAHYDLNLPLDKINLYSGPKTNNFPAKCVVNDNLMHDLGIFEKQVAGVQISMAQDIKVSHNTIYNVPRAGININDGMWGGHIIEFNDVFNTVMETSDNGAFNSWGRDRNYAGNRNLDSILESQRDKVALLDNVKPTIIRNNRFRCDHGWDIDLDDGSTNYIIYDNLLLNGGLKFREGFFRIAENNIIINNSFHPHVWYKNSDDIFRKNVVTTSYFPIGMPVVWTKEIDWNIFLDSIVLEKSKLNGRDTHSVYTPLLFVNAAKGDYRLLKNSPAFLVGFKNFDMDHFGVVSKELKLLKQKIPLPKLLYFDPNKSNGIYTVLSLNVRNMTLDERSATGMFAEKGTFVESVNNDSKFYGIIKPNDVIISYNGIQISDVRDLKDATIALNFNNSITISVFRGGGIMNVKLPK